MFTIDELMTTLETKGTENTRTIYEKHGVHSDQFGVSYNDLRALQKRIKFDHDLATALWASGNHDARVFACMIADPRRTSYDELDGWAAALTNYMQSDALAQFVANTRYARDLMLAWTSSPAEWIGATGWTVLAHLATDDQALDDRFFYRFLDTIRTEIHTRPNRVRHAMNNALIAIGLRSDELEARSLEVARAIGKVQVDHGRTSCKTPDAAAYIARVKARRA